MEVLQFGRALLFLGTCLTVVIFLLALLGIITRDRRFVLSARTGFYGLLVIIAGSAGCLIYGFVSGQYSNEYIYNYSEKLLPTGFKVAGLWAGLDGSLLFWTLVLSAWSAAAALQHRWSARHPTGRRLEPYVYLVLAVVTFFFCLITWNENPFSVMPLDQRLRLAGTHSIGTDTSGNLLDGAGLNQQLVNYWFVIHPPTLYMGFVGFTIPFAFAMAALLAGELGDYWIRIIRRWTMVTWIFLTSGVILGGLWAYRQLGWGGYWAWDPVENASFLPWCTGTAFLHSVMIQERRDILKGWNVFLILLTFFLTIVATWMTRSGVVDSVHAFAGGDIGIWFQGFLFFIAAVAVFLFFFRFRSLRGTQRLESVLSREAAFFINNLILVLIAAIIFFLSFYDKISHDWFGVDAKNPGMFNVVVTPFFAVLLFLTAVGPSLGWVKTSPSSLRRNFFAPLLATALFTVGVYVFLYWRGLMGTWEEVLVPRLHNQHPSAFYPTGLFLALAFFIFATVFSEFFRGMKSRVKFRKEDVGTAFFNLVGRNNRRYGGYLVHVGIAILTMGIIVSSMFKIKKEQVSVRVGESVEIGPYLVTPVKQDFNAVPQVGQPYKLDEVLFRVTRNPTGLPVAHGVAAHEGAGGSGEFVAELKAERRFYPKSGTWISEVSIHRRLLEDIYIYYPDGDQEGNLYLTVFLNPLMIFIYLGWFTMLGGAIFAVLPISGNKVGLSE